MKILVTGGSGLVGNHLKKYLPNAIYTSSKDYDLTLENDVIRLFHDHKPNIVIHLAAKVGGIIDNIQKPAEYFDENILMNTFMLKYSKLNNVDRFIGILSTCIYPDKVTNYPMTESDLHLGPPTQTNFSYGYSKRSLAVQIDSYNQQYGTKYQYLIPCNLYGVGDKDEEDKSHFLTALIKKIVDAKLEGKTKIELYGDGTPLRQFLFAEDFAKIIYEVINQNICESFNVAGDENLSINEMVQIALKVCNSDYLQIEWNREKPNGQFRKDVSNKKMKTLLPNFNLLNLEEGIKKVYQSYNDKISQ
jgi:GDP-L-fucose synthase